MSAPRTLVVSLVALVTLSAAPGRPDNPAPTPSADDKPPAKAKDQPPAQLPTESAIMRAKVKESQALLDAIAREDFKKVREHASALARISDGAEFLNAHKAEEYMVQARMFRRIVGTMATKAEDRNIDGVMLAYMDMSNSCLKCHQYTRDRKRD
jgi:hypothetical protein